MNIAFVVNVPSFFLSHRFAIAHKALQCGYQVTLVSGRDTTPELQKASLDKLNQENIKWLDAYFTPAGTNPFSEAVGLLSVIRQVNNIQPHVLHTVTPKGNLYGGIAARLCRVPKLVVAVSGQGFLFTGKRNGIRKWLASLYLALIRWVYAHPNCTVIVQNRDDWNSLLASNLVDERQLVLIPGSGVDLALFADQDLQQAEKIVLLPARMLTDKGIVEFVEAAKILKQRGLDWRFVLVGDADGPNPAAISSSQIQKWVAEGLVEWWGFQHDMVAILKRVAIVCLPSYREGMPKALLEAAAAGKPVVTTDAIGCREAIIAGETGLLVPVAEARALADALQRLIQNEALRLQFGAAGRRLAEQRYSIESVVEATLSLYRA